MATKNGDGKVKLTITVDQTTGRVEMKGPAQPEVCFKMLQAGFAQLFQHVANASAPPERKVKTLDEMGVSHRISRIE